MLEQNPNAHLSLIEVIANLIEIVIEDLLQVVRLNRHYFSQKLLSSFLFLLVICHHKLEFSLENLTQELSAQFAHPDDFLGLFLPPVFIHWPDSDLPFEIHASTIRDKETFKRLDSSLLSQISRQSVIKCDSFL